MGNGNGSTTLHQSLQGLLYQSLRLGVESRGGLVKDEDRGILQDGTGNRHTLALTTRQSSATVTNHRVVAILALHDEFVGIGNLRCLDDLLHGGIFHTEGDVVIEGVVEEDSLLINVAYEGAQLGNSHTLDVFSIDEHLTVLHVMIAWNEVYQCRLARA